jgi:(p)ppGpp synthase/HD superfamily hydrolase
VAAGTPIVVTSDAPTIADRAAAFVARAYDGADPRLLEHCRAVAALLAELGCEDHVVATGLLHDVVEDTPVALPELRERFGDRVADLVAVLTENEAITGYRERKRALRDGIAGAGHTAMVIFAADKLARVRAADERGEPIEPRKLEHYLRTAELLASHGIRTPHVAELNRRLRAFRRYPSRAAAGA